ncbi:uncharacterized protein OCT59_022189 [Rhizophagus irregularis]|uniref:uncharacterized protein n=1 Tax=Rhizophagus irregularis TaxID=588596 RepID=UPI00332C0C31|nr:hypothetical protein OCT59_022189 [Rhizophagus irregularis]
MFLAEGTEEEILQLLVGESTVQIWHQIKDDGKNKGDLPNNGNPFLEYIWSNRIPINQERDKTKLRIEYFKCGSNDRSHEKLNDFHLKVYWDMITYIELIVWKFAKLEPQNFRLLDIRHNIMKSLILSDCDDLIKYVLFGNEESIGNKVVHDEPRHILRNNLWPKRSFLKEDDLDFAEKIDYGLKETIKPENNMELAIYHCKGKPLNLLLLRCRIICHD